MFFSSQRKDLYLARDEAKQIFNNTNTKPKILSIQNTTTFFGELGYSFKLISEEKEIILFAILQWLVIGIAYLLWTQILDWIPDSLWEEMGKSTNKNDGNGAFGLINLLLFGWSLLVITVVSYPLSLFSAAMTASHYLRSSSQESTIFKCMNIARKNLGRIWVFTTIDAFITARAILDRLPKKRGRRTAYEELAYYAWKIGTIGVLPALVAGKGYIDAAKDSILLLRQRPLRTIGIRMGYSLLCWIVGISAYILSIRYFYTHGLDSMSKDNFIYAFYVIMAVPIFIAVGVTTVVLRPFFLIMISKLYTDTIPVDAKITAPVEKNKFDMLFAVFIVMLTTLLTLYFFGDQLGIREWIESLAAKDSQEYQNLQNNLNQ